MAITGNRVYDIVKRFYYQHVIDPVVQRSGVLHSIPKTAEEFSFEVHLAEHCDLNCAGCSHFSPLAEPELADYEETARDFARLSSLFHGHVQAINLLGGEPLLHPDLIKFFKMARENFPDADILLVTNGIRLLKQPEEFWLACKENNISIHPTRYPIHLDYQEMEKRAADHGVEYHYYASSKTDVRKFNFLRLDVEGLQDSRKNFMLCTNANNCVNLYHGRLYTCPIAPMARHFSKYFGKKLKEVPENSIDIYQANSAQEIMEFLARPIPFCRHCMRNKTRWNRPWRQSEQAIEEWT